MRTESLAAGFAALVLAATLPAAGGPASNPAWEKLKTLGGTWQGTVEGKPVSVTYSLVSNGTALMESLTGEHDTHMVTMYHPDGGTVLATHYCAAGNQPRMRAQAAAGAAQSLDFQFVDATNVSGSTGEVMRRLVVTFQGPDHFTQAWTSSAGGKEQTTDFVYTRKK
jgi:hypothetical protein